MFSFFSELGAPFDVAQDMLCAFAGVISLPVLIHTSPDKYNYVWFVLELFQAFQTESDGRNDSGQGQG